MRSCCDLGLDFVPSAPNFNARGIMCGISPRECERAVLANTAINVIDVALCTFVLSAPGQS